MDQDKRTLSSTERLSLIQTLNSLPGPQFDELLFALNPPIANVPGNATPQGSRSAALLKWIESPIGPGLAELEAILESITTTQPGTAMQASARNQTVETLKDIIQVLSTSQVPKDELQGAQFSDGCAGTVQRNQMSNSQANPKTYHQSNIQTQEGKNKKKRKLKTHWKLFIFCAGAVTIGATLFNGYRSEKQQQLRGLILYYSDGDQDNATISRSDLEQRGYRHAFNEACILSNPESGTRPLVLLWNNQRKDYATLSRPEAIAWQKGYVNIGTEGYVYTSQRQGTIPLYLYWNPEIQDNATVASIQAIGWQAASDYNYGGIEGYVYPYTADTCAPELD